MSVNAPSDHKNTGNVETIWQVGVLLRYADLRVILYKINVLVVQQYTIFQESLPNTTDYETLAKVIYPHEF